MFESFLTEALTKNFGHLIENLDADNVRLSTWNGQVDLEDVSLRRDAFDHFIRDSPVEIAYGRVGKLSLSIPWKIVRIQMWRGKSEDHTLKCQVVLTDVNILITPKRRLPGNQLATDDSEQATSKHEWEAADKENRAQNLVDAELLRQVTQSSNSSSRRKWIQDRLAGILSTLSVTIKRIHVRYEDPGSCMGFNWVIGSPGQRYRSSFSFGITLKEFSVHAKGKDQATTDTHQVEKDLDHSHKTAAADCLAIYWDSASRIMSNRIDFTDEAVEFEQAFVFLNSPLDGASIRLRSRLPSRRTYLLDPISPVIELSLAVQSDESSYSTMTASCPPCHFSLSRGLLEDLGYLRQSISVWTQLKRSMLSGETILRLAELRPRESPTSNPRGWWKYVFEAVHIVHQTDSMVVRYKGWQKLVKALTRRRLYLSMYRGLFSCKDTQERERIHMRLIENERDLTVQEIAQFRIFACKSLVEEGLISAGTPTFDDDSALSSLKESPRLTWEGRLRRFQGVAEALSRVAVNEHAVSSNQTALQEVNEKESTAPSWRAQLVFEELAFQVNDTEKSQVGRCPRTSSVVKASCSFRQNLELMKDGSWGISCYVSDLVVEDCTSGRAGLFPHLLSGKPRGLEKRECITVEVFRKRRLVRGINHGSTTTTSVRMEPMEVVYSTYPVEALSRVFNSVRMDLADDYHRMGARLYQWRERQKKRLFAALSHKEKVIVVDIDIGAPTVLIPEACALGSSLLIFDLGKLRFFNSQRHKKQIAMSRGGQQWTLNIEKVQVRCSKTDFYCLPTDSKQSLDDEPSPEQVVVEPFSLNLAVETLFSGEGTSDLNYIAVQATLPRLVLNMAASVVHLFRRLNQQWAKRKLDLGSATKNNLQFESPPQRISFNEHKDTDGGHGGFRFEFSFVAPFLQLRLSDDVAANQSQQKQPLPLGLLDLVLRGIEGKILMTRNSQEGQMIQYLAKMNSVNVRDLYQTGGSDFSSLLSSTPPEVSDSHFASSGTDLVSFEYNRKDLSDSAGSLSVRFNELYLEWNPETLASVQVALRLPVEEDCAGERANEDDDTFFDAEEDNFFDADSDGTSVASAEISEIASSQHSSFADLGHLQNQLHSQFPLLLRSPVSRLVPQQEPIGSQLAGMSPASLLSTPRVTRESQRPFLVVFTLAKLRVNFNKDARHRRLFTAEMDATFCKVSIVPSAGWDTNATLGNLVFTDAASKSSGTLYREILGLKTDASSTNQSLLELKISSKPRRRFYNDAGRSLNRGVNIDSERGVAEGEDLVVCAKFSPMRFVYLQQLWFEIIDYFFEGIVGYEVFGAKRPEPVSASSVVPDIRTADSFSFLKLDVSLEAPVLLVPVAYCSTNYLQCDLDSVRIENFYQFRTMRHETNESSKLQWFNNCSIKMENWKLRGWHGSSISETDSSAVSALVLINWPTGPTASLNVPKWKVTCEFDNPLCLVLQKDDYALFQHVISSNLGESSRHLEEWEALQNLSPDSLQLFQKKINVHFGYDKKDGTPTTFDVSVSLSELSLKLQNRALQEIALIRSSSTRWTYIKLSDLVSIQKLQCFLTVSGHDEVERRSLLSSLDADTEPSVSLVYSSHSWPTGNNKKRLDVGAAQIEVHYFAWTDLAGFFQGLPSPTYLSPNEVIQVGDRWYRIGGNKVERDEKQLQESSLDWIPKETPVILPLQENKSDPSFSFDFSLLDPRIVLGDKSQQVMLVLKEVLFSHRGTGGLISRNFTLREIEVRVLEEGMISNRNRVSLIQPWNISGNAHYSTDGASCPLREHTFRATAGVLRAQAAFSDLVVASSVGLELHKSAQRKKRMDRDIARPGKDVESQWNDSSYISMSRLLSFELERVVFDVVDDSCRHFAGPQELVRLEVDSICYSQRIDKLCEAKQRDTQYRNNRVSEMNVSVKTLTLVDCLQSPESPFRYLVHCGLGNETPDRIEAICIAHRTGSFHQQIELSLEALQVQYNPSIIVALQRFLGRLRKEMNLDGRGSIEFRGEKVEVLPKKNDDDKLRKVEASIRLHYVAIALNKEHQGRCLAKFNTSDCALKLDKTAVGLSVSGEIGSVSIDDADQGQRAGFPSANAVILRSAEGYDFLQFRYQTFAARALTSEDDVPNWVQVQLVADQKIDDFLEVVISPVNFVFLSDRTKELIDYLSNGLPGKGMGIGAMAAKGFVEQRIEKRSFFQLQINAPVVRAPVDSLREDGFQVTGNLALESCVLSDDQTIRTSALTIEGLHVASYASQITAPRQPVVENFGVLVNVERRPGAMKVVCTVEKLIVTLAYSDYVLCQETYHGNLGKKADKARWDNLESAWEKEASIESVTFSRDIQYSESVRHVRYGTAGTKRNSTRRETELSIVVTLGLTSFLIRRDDAYLGQKEQLSYDIVSMKLVDSELAANKDAEGVQGSITVKGFDLEDVGERGRSLRDLASGAVRLQSQFTTIVEGYEPEDSEEAGTAQLIVSVDRGKSTITRTTNVSVLVNYLRLTVLPTPMREVVDFFKCEWSPETPELMKSSNLADSRLNRSLEADFNESMTSATIVRFVLHYPQVLLIAEEFNSRSKAVVLSGLAIVNGSTKKDRIKEMDSETILQDERALRADLQNISTYIYADVSAFLAGQIKPSEGVALLLPLTLGIDLEEKKTQEATQRSLAVSVEKVSIVLGAGDINLFSSLKQKLSSRKETTGPKSLKDIPRKAHVRFMVTFDEQRLGLGLRKEGDYTVVESSDDPRVAVGDRIISINGTPVGQATLPGVVLSLKSEARPLRLELSGSRARDLSSLVAAKQTTSLDLSISHATISLVDTDVQLLRGEMNGTRLNWRIQEDPENIDTLLSTSSTIAVDHFNQRVKMWEPTMEPSFFFCAREMAEAKRQGTKEISMELGDRESGPILFNFADSFVTVADRVARKLRGDVQELSGGTDISDGDLADAAFLFASRQNQHAKKADDTVQTHGNGHGTPHRLSNDALLIQNMLPVDLLCQISADGDVTRLKPGELCDFEYHEAAPIAVRFNVEGWSQWYSVNEGDIQVSVEQTYGRPPVSFLAKADRRESSNQWQIFVYAELWFLNTTGLAMSFGAPRDQMVRKPWLLESDDIGVTAAQAALKEISALFDTGEEFPDTDEIAPSSFNSEICPLPAQAGAFVTDEIFEYIKVKDSLVKRRWWAGEIGTSWQSPDLNSKIEQVVDSSWEIDESGDTMEGWESSASLTGFRRTFSPEHRYRRRRFIQQRWTDKQYVNGFHQPIEREQTDKKSDETDSVIVAVQVGGGLWSAASLPRHGKVFGALRIAGERWQTTRGGIYEICYSVTALDGPWGEVSRLLTVSSRFCLLNFSRSITFEVKQNGESEDKQKILRIGPGETKPFHWTSSHLPELICVRPCVGSSSEPSHQWSGGFDPVTIGSIPVRVRSLTPDEDDIRTLKTESEIRPKSGGTGINISFVEEDVSDGSSLFRIENLSPLPIWISQDGVLSRGVTSRSSEGDILRPSSSCAFGLDVPFRQGKYSGRKAEGMEELIRLRLSLAPQASHEGIETTKVVPLMKTGAIVRLNPSKLQMLPRDLQDVLQQIRILGVTFNDGPTRVLRLSLVRRSDSATLRSLPKNGIFEPISSSPVVSTSTARYLSEIHKGAVAVEKQIRSGAFLPLEEEVVAGANSIIDPSIQQLILGSDRVATIGENTVFSFRLAFSGFVLSAIDSIPSEIAVLSLRNLNALASWNVPRTKDATVYVTVEDVQVDNMIPNSPYPIAACRADIELDLQGEGPAPLLVIGLSFAPEHKSGVICLKSVTVAPRNLAIRVDLAFLVRLQKFALDAKAHFESTDAETPESLNVPDIEKRIEDATAFVADGVDRQKFYFGGLTILPCNIRLSVAPARALTPAQAMLEGEDAAAIHQAVRKGDVKLGDSSALLGVKVGSRNKTALAVARGVLKSIVVDALLRLDGASLNFAGVSLRNHVSTAPQLGTHIGAHYLASLRQNVPALLASMAAFGNPLGLVRGLGDGVSDFVLEPVKGFQRSVQELDASYLVDGVARGTISLARHTVGGFADTAASLTETFSKNMTVLTLDRRYAQKRDRGENLRNMEDVNVAFGLGSGVQKLVQGFLDGVTGVVKAPIHGANKRGFEGFAKGIGKGLLGLLVKPVIGISDGITDFMIGVKATIEGAAGPNANVQTQIRPRRAFLGKSRILSPYNPADAAAQALLQRTRIAGENYVGHVDMQDRVALFGVRRMVLLGSTGEELLVLKYKHIDTLQTRKVQMEDGSEGWCVLIILNTRRNNDADMEVVTCKEQAHALELKRLLEIAKLDDAAGERLETS